MVWMKLKILQCTLNTDLHSQPKIAAVTYREPLSKVTECWNIKVQLSPTLIGNTGVSHNMHDT